MGLRFRSVKWNRVLVDVCTQRDYLDAGSILEVANRESLLPTLRELFRWAKLARLPLVSIVESHRPSEPLNGFPLHCIDGTPGQEKLPFTYLPPWIIVETDNYLSLPPDVDEKNRQLIFRKRTRDVLSNPKADRFLTQLSAEYLIFGVGLERAIKCLALGLQLRQKPVSVITDACGYWSAGDADLATRQLAAKGIGILTSAELMTEQSPPRARPRARVLADRHHPGLVTRRQRVRSDAI